MISLSRLKDTIRYRHFASWRHKLKFSIFVMWLCMIISFGHTVKPLSNKEDIVAISISFLTHIEWPRGNAFLFHYLQIGDQYYNTDFVDVCIQPVKNDTTIPGTRSSNHFVPESTSKVSFEVEIKTLYSHLLISKKNMLK